ncbi:MAG: endonuclease/exonuclease/phosphatase family protein [Clostridia bacterium]|nr:endonuclease/exonuclease/phosphatase family protein [Clostridia bacterium]
MEQIAPLLQKILLFFLSVISLLNTATDSPIRAVNPADPVTEPAVVWADAYEEGAFPLIDVTEKPAGAIRVMSFNLRNQDVAGVPRKDRTAIVIRKIQEIAPDVFGVQEATANGWMKALKRDLPEYAYAGSGKLGGDEGSHNAVFYKKDRFELLDTGTYWLSETPSESSFGWDAAAIRIFTYAVLRDKTTGKTFVHVNSHFDHIGVAARRNEATQVSNYIREHFADLPVIFTADMNAREDSEPYAIMTALLHNAKYTARDSVFYATFHGADPKNHQQSYIDHILHNDKVSVAVFRVVTTGIDGRYVSDHFPLYADIYLDA